MLKNLHGGVNEFEHECSSDDLKLPLHSGMTSFGTMPVLLDDSLDEECSRNQKTYCRTKFEASSFLHRGGVKGFLLKSPEHKPATSVQQRGSEGKEA